jgi:hypothetical protein
MFPTSYHGTCDVGNTALEQDVVYVEERFIAVNEEAPTGIKQKEIPKDVYFPEIKPKPNEVSYVCVCLSSDTFYHCSEVSIFL